jgi:PHD/YefM family antitoxin component YafN of YafNO toxin-antitoxin module
MKTINYSDFSINVRTCLSEVVNENIPLHIHCAYHQDVVIIPFDIYEAMEDSLAIMCSPQIKEWLDSTYKKNNTGESNKKDVDN